MLRLLEAENPAPVLRVMAASGILAGIFPMTVDVARLERLAMLDARNFFAPDPLLRLAALLPDDVIAARALCDRWKLSNADRMRLEEALRRRGKDRLLSLHPRSAQAALSAGPARLQGSRQFCAGPEITRRSNSVQWRALLALADAWVRPDFPLTGRDVMAAGVAEGPLVGRILSEVEDWWIDADFTEDEFSLAERLKAVVQATAY